MRIIVYEQNLRKILTDFVKEVAEEAKHEVWAQIYLQEIRGRVPPLSPVTIIKKGHDLILIETYSMVQSYDYYMHSDGLGFDLGIIGTPDIASYAVVHEYGSLARHIPPRPVLRWLFTPQEFSRILALASLW